MNVCTIDSIKQNLIDAFKSETILPLFGSGFSMHAETESEGIVPSGREYKKYMLKNVKEKCSNLKQATLEKLESASFSTVCDFYEGQKDISEKDRRDYYKNNFKGVKLDELRKKILQINWPYIYTLNFDDAIEKNSQFSNIVYSNRKFHKSVFEEFKCVVKLHGDVGDYITYKDSNCRIFTSKEYKSSLKTNNELLVKLKHDWSFYNLIIIGCSFADELDLLSIQDTPLDNNENIARIRRMLFTAEEPDEFEIPTLEKYNITDVVVFEDYNKIYESLFSLWKESQKIQKSELINYQYLKIVNLMNDNKNEPYFYYGKNLLNEKKQCITIPYFFTGRELTTKIIDNFNKNTIHLVRGNRVCGKSYLLIDIYNTIKNQKILVFNGHDTISDSALQKLLEEKDIIVLFDIGSITREQFKKLILNFRKINKNRNNVVIILSNNSTDFFGILKVRIMDNNITEDDLCRYELSNKFSFSEIEKINKKLPRITFPEFSSEKTVIDNLIYSAELMTKRSKFDCIKLSNFNEKLMALLIILASKEKIYSYDLIKFDLLREAYTLTEQYPEIFEEYSLFNFERDIINNSNKKIVVNSKYWLTRELGRISSISSNIECIINSYIYIINQIFLSTQKDTERRKDYRDYILYDVINNTFFKTNKSDQLYQIKLITLIYASLQDQLADDYQYLHQYAKCSLRYSYILEKQEEKKEWLNKALDLINVSYSKLKNLMKNSTDNFLDISLAHIEYTRATVLCELCKVGLYKNIEQLQTTINAVYTAINSPYNSDDYERDSKKSIGIKDFFYHLSLDKFILSTVDKEHSHIFYKAFNATRSI